MFPLKGDSACIMYDDDVSDIGHSDSGSVCRFSHDGRNERNEKKVVASTFHSSFFRFIFLLKFDYINLSFP
jgi:hypothetical protein